MASDQTDRRNGLTTSLAIKAPVKAATAAAAAALSGLLIVDGYQSVAGDRILVKNQVDQKTNGIYNAAAGAWTRAKDSDGNLDWMQGTIVHVLNGTVSAGLFYEQTTAGTITVGTSNLAFAVVSPSSPITLPLSLAQGGTGGTTAIGGLANLGVIQVTGEAGTANVQTGTIDALVTALRADQLFIHTPSITNTGATTITYTPNGGAALAAKNVFFDGAALTGGELVLGVPTILHFDGVELNIIGHTRKLFQGAAGTDGQAVAADSTKTAGFAYIDNPSRPNLLINPNWQIDQINEGGLYTINGAAANGPDGWSGEAIGGGGGVVKLRTLVDPDNAALRCLEITCTTADAAIAAGERYSIFAAVEGYDAAALQAGLASAQSVTLQFKYKTSVAGVYGVSLANSAKNRSYVGIINVADANEHEYSLIVPMDTAGVWLYTNGVGLYLRLTLAGGANFQAVAGAWNAADNYCTAAQANFMSNIANIAYLKRIQLIPGALVQAYRPADIQKELAKAQRYYAKTFAQGTAPAQSAGGSGALFVSLGGVAGPAINWRFPVPMRAAPTVVTYNPSANNTAWRNATAGTDIAVTVSPDAGATGDSVHIAAGANGAGNDHCYIHASAAVRLS